MIANGSQRLFVWKSYMVHCLPVSMYFLNTECNLCVCFKSTMRSNFATDVCFLVAYKGITIVTERLGNVALESSI